MGTMCIRNDNYDFESSNKFDIWRVIGDELIDFASPPLATFLRLLFNFQDGMQASPMLQHFPFHVPSRRRRNVYEYCNKK